MPSSASEREEAIASSSGSQTITTKCIYAPYTEWAKKKRNGTWVCIRSMCARNNIREQQRIQIICKMEDDEEREEKKKCTKEAHTKVRWKKNCLPNKKNKESKRMFVGTATQPHSRTQTSESDTRSRLLPERKKRAKWIILPIRTPFNPSTKNKPVTNWIFRWPEQKRIRRVYATHKWMYSNGFDAELGRDSTDVVQKGACRMLGKNLI